MNYRDKLVQMIQEAGKELIDRAEIIIPNKTEMITSTTITIRIPTRTEYVTAPTIETSIETLCKNSVERLRNNM